ncbi:putative lipoprotein YerB precursor [Streptomyces sp. YIM 130001]|uniref:DUF3048 domain-containing protein n=1 Tax=Streptomyces sp. YIM 130001 TaxID=2259644 RepID=UPI000E64D45D|nr:DUF3048 domain-containing protein [Streptomyces sp. YIM 130001]RII12303.1 putative lipoprotein YerB precursor [Streptomyces sp. YIM 130001]
MRRRAFLSGSAAVGAGTLLGAAALAACTVEGRAPGGGSDDTPEPDESGSAAGRPRDDPTVLAVKIDNAPAARPHTGLAEADIIHVEQVESGISRLLAVYAAAGRLPKAIGPVRSARETDLALLRQYGEPVLAYSGAQSKLEPLIDAAPLHPRTPESTGGAYYRSTDRPAPHNLYLRPRELDPAPDADRITAYGLRFGAAPSGGQRRATHTVRFPAARFEFTWSGADRHWQVAMDGGASPHAPASVLVQYTRVRDSGFKDRWGNVSPYTETTGSGQVLLLRDGRAHDGRWSRPDEGAPTRYTDAEDRPLAFPQGQIWVVYVRQ